MYIKVHRLRLGLHFGRHRGTPQRAAREFQRGRTATPRGRQAEHAGQDRERTGRKTRGHDQYRNNRNFLHSLFLDTCHLFLKGYTLKHRTVLIFDNPTGRGHTAEWIIPGDGASAPLASSPACPRITPTTRVTSARLRKSTPPPPPSTPCRDVVQNSQRSRSNSYNAARRWRPLGHEAPPPAATRRPPSAARHRETPAPIGWLAMHAFASHAVFGGVPGPGSASLCPALRLARPTDPPEGFIRGGGVRQGHTLEGALRPASLPRCRVPYRGGGRAAEVLPLVPGRLRGTAACREIGRGLGMYLSKMKHTKGAWEKGGAT